VNHFGMRPGMTSAELVMEEPDPYPIAREFVTGPIATFTLEQNILASGGLPALAGFHF
jgi:hypothetical protein